MCSCILAAVQLAFDAADRLVELVEERRGPVPAGEAARALFALAQAPEGLARSLLDDVVAGDARLAWRGANVGLAAPPGRDLPLEAARFVVVDLETTGLRPAQSAICEIGAVRVDALLPAGTFQTLVDPGVPIPPVIAGITGIADRDLRGAPRPAAAVRAFLAFAGDGAVIVAHNARFDLAFLDREVELISGRRLAAPVVDTVGLARRLLAGRAPRVGLASLAQFFGTSVRPCHRALPDAQATAEILVALVGLAQERGARTVADLVELSAPRRRRVYEKRSLVFGAPTRPGVYVFRDANGQALYVGRARDLRARLRSYFRSERQRPAVEAALAAVERVEWEVLGSELEAALEELRLIRELRPPANARGKRGGRGFYLRRRGEQVVVSERPGPLGPIGSRRRAERAARALAGASEDELAGLLAGRPAAATPDATRRPLRLPPLRGRGAPARPHRGARAGHPRAGRARAAAVARGVPAGSRLPGRVHAGGLRRARAGRRRARAAAGCRRRAGGPGGPGRSPRRPSLRWRPEDAEELAAPGRRSCAGPPPELTVAAARRARDPRRRCVIRLPQ